MSVTSRVSTLEELRGHGFVDELRGSVHQSHGSVQVVVHHCDVERRLAQSSWRKHHSFTSSFLRVRHGDPDRPSLCGLTSLKDVGGRTAQQLLDAADTVVFRRIEEGNIIYAEGGSEGKNTTFKQQGPTAACNWLGDQLSCGFLTIWSRAWTFHPTSRSILSCSGGETSAGSTSGWAHWEQIWPETETWTPAVWLEDTRGKATTTNIKPQD